MLSTAFLMHPEVYNQVDRQECVRVDLGTGVTQKLSTDFIRVVPQTSRNQLTGNRPWVRIPPAPPQAPESTTFSGAFSILTRRPALGRRAFSFRKAVIRYM